MNELGWLITPVLSAVVAALIGALTAQFTLRKEKKSANAEREKLLYDGMKILMKQRLYDIYEEWQTSGEVSLETKELATEAHNVYKGLGGNHTGDRLYEDIMSA